MWGKGEESHAGHGVVGKKQSGLEEKGWFEKSSVMMIQIVSRGGVWYNREADKLEFIYEKGVKLYGIQ